MKRVFLFFLIVSLSGSASAGLWGISHHSRANCVNNESVSWWANHNEWYFVSSEHYDAITGRQYHFVSTGWQNTWRAAAVHWFEGDGRDKIHYKVHGRHWMPIGGRTYLVSEEWVEDCSIYDGWWD